MEDHEVREIMREIDAREAANVETLRAALAVLDTIAAKRRTGVRRDMGKAITAATRAADDIRRVLWFRFEEEA